MDHISQSFPMEWLHARYENNRPKIWILNNNEKYKSAHSHIINLMAFESRLSATAVDGVGQ